MEIVVTAVSLAVVVLAYLHVSAIDRSFVNVLTPAYAVFIPANYLVELFWLSYSRPAGSTYAYLLSYGSYAALFVGVAIGYSMKVGRVRLPLSVRATEGSAAVAWMVLLVAWLLYLPVLVQFREHLGNPREIYELSRFGYGQYFFFSTMLCYFSVVLLLYSRAGIVQRLVFFLVALFFAYLHGSKHHMLMPFFILAVWFVYARGRTVSITGFLLFIFLVATLGVGLFMVTNPGVLMYHGVDGLIGYSGYTHNGMLVIDAGTGPMFGSMSMEKEVFARTPRILFPDKPIHFGDLRLSAQFFPEETNMGTGAPAMGFGGLFADYGMAVPFLLLLLGFFKGILLRVFSNNVKSRGTPGDLIMLLFGAGIPLIPFSGVFLLPETIVLAVAANCLVSLVIITRAHRSGLAEAAP